MADHAERPSRSTASARIASQDKPASAAGPASQHATMMANAPRSVALTTTAQTLNHAAAQRMANRTGLPDALKTGIETLSGRSLDDVRVHRNSSRPAQLQAHAYAQGRNIYLAPGQDRHLPHEAWHVVQQAQGRVRPTMQMMDRVPVNDDRGLEREADLMGEKAHRLARASVAEAGAAPRSLPPLRAARGVVQAVFTEVATRSGAPRWRDEKGVIYAPVEARVDDQVKICSKNGVPFYIRLVKRRWYRQGEPLIATPAPVKNQPQIIPTPKEPQFFVGGGGAVLARRESFDSVDSEGEDYHVSGSEQHEALAAHAKRVERQKKTENVVAASLSAVFRYPDGKKVQITTELRSMWNSGYFQHILSADEDAAPMDFGEQQKGAVKALLPEKKFNASLHAHSEVSMAADPEIVQKLMNAYGAIIKKAGKRATILKMIVRVHSSPNTVCMNACHAALAEVRKKAAFLAVGSEEAGIRISGRFAVELMATSDKPFMKFSGNKPHKALAAGDELDPAPPRGKEGRLIEVLNNQDKDKEK